MSLRTIRSVHFYTIQNSPEFADDKECNNMTFGDKIKTKCKIKEKIFIAIIKST